MKKTWLIVALAIIGCGSGALPTSSSLTRAEVIWETQTTDYSLVKFRLDGECFLQRTRQCHALNCASKSDEVLSTLCSAE